MGCDIHLYVEIKHNGKWVMVNEIDGPGRDRNYRRFAALAGVRGEGPAPRGLPEDASESVRFHAEDCGEDGHSHSWLPMSEAIPIFAATEHLGTKDAEAAARWPAYHYFRIEDDKVDDFRIVFWFDN